MSLESVNAFWEWFDQVRGDTPIRQIERRAGVPRSRIGNAYSARREPTALICDAIADGLKIRKSEVLRRAGILPPKPEESELTEELLHHFGQLSPEDQERALAIVRALAEQGAGRGRGA